MKPDDSKRKVLKDLLALAKSMKVDAMKSKFAPKAMADEADSSDADPVEGVEIEVEPSDESAPDVESVSPMHDPKAVELLKQLQSDPAALKKLLGK